MDSLRSSSLAALGAGALAIAGAFAVGLSSAASAPSAATDWRAVSAVGFPDVARALIDGELNAGLVAAWTGALDEDAQVASRAAVLLGGALSRDSAPPEAKEAAAGALLARLQARVSAGSRYAVGADVVAARALDGRARADASVADALEGLAAGARPHPDLAVRVECASVVLAVEARPAVVEFLLAVLRAETPDAAKSPPSWERVKALAWVKTRAAAALSDAAGVPLRFRPDGSWAHQNEEADRLEAQLRAR